MNDALIKETDDILISIIIATFNAQDQIGQCIQSIIDVAQKKLEIIIIDGASTDNTKSIVEQFSEENIIWKSEPDKGIYDALNKGITLAKGKWFYFMGSDDRLLPGFSELASFLSVENAVYYGDTEPGYYGDKKPGYELLSGKFSNYRLAKYCINHQAIFYPAAVFIKNNYDLRYKIFADYALNLRLWGDRNFQKLYYPITIARYNMTGFSSTIKDAEFKKDKPNLIRKNLGTWMYIRFLLKRYKKKIKGEKGFE